MGQAEYAPTPGTTPNPKRAQLDEQLAAIQELAFVVEAKATGVESMLLAGGVPAAVSDTPDPEGYADRTLNTYGRVQLALEHTIQVLNHVDEEFRERPHDVSPARG